MDLLRIDDIPECIKKEIVEYFATELPQYEVDTIVRQSNHPDDSYLYMVSAHKENGERACWTCYNSSTKSLNFGHYGLESENEVADILSENYCDCTKGE